MRTIKEIMIGNSYFSGRFLFVLALLLPVLSIAQKEKKFIYEGNKHYEKKDYAEAEKEYNKALGKNKDSYKAGFNLGDAYYNQGKYEEAANQFQSLTHRATSKDTLAKTYHNLGNSLLKCKKYPECIDAYKNALKNNPGDNDTRYNLSYAQQMLKQQQEQQKKDKEKEDKKKEKEKKEDKDKEKDKDKEDKEKDGQKDKKDQQHQISKEDAKRILDALQNDEKELQDKMKKGKTNGVKVKPEKDW